MSDKLDEAIKWIISGNAKAFRDDFDVVTAKFPDLDDADIAVLKSIQEKGIAPDQRPDGELSDAQLDAVAGGVMAPTRSHGW